ncbi:copper-binding protein [Rubrivirga sp. IMCC43871]|uniref:copper-binding protein n=1 Tax=Rubrivirga sp. IMCC43871 TaxID=3391575 RepID=UPI0039900EDE
MRPVLLVATLVLAAGCTQPEPPTLRVRAVYLEPMYDGQAMRVDHEAIPDVMPAMEMPLSVLSPDLLADLAPGAIVRLTLDSASLRVLDVERLPEGTVLTLGEDDPDGGIVLPSMEPGGTD